MKKRERLAGEVKVPDRMFCVPAKAACAPWVCVALGRTGFLSNREAFSMLPEGISSVGLLSKYK